MHIKNFKIFCFSLIAIILPLSVSAQPTTYSNNWINYGKPYLKVNVSKKGLHKLPFSLLPSEFSTSQPEKIQLWHRGKQISIISTDNSEILFYGVPNDGSSDSLFYRPMSSRLNPYSSMYSDESSYFLTVGDSLGLRAQVVNQSADNSITILPNNLSKLSTSFRDDYSLSTKNPIRPVFFNSFFEIGASKTGKITLGGVLSTYSLSLNNLDTVAVYSPSVEVLVHGRSNNSRDIEIYIGKDEASLRLVSKISNSGFAASKYAFNLKSGDLNNAGKGMLAFKSVSTDKLDRFSVAYYDIYYPQLFTMTGETTHEFGLISTTAPWSRIKVVNTPPSSRILDITDVDKPRVIAGSADNLMVSRLPGKFLNLLVTTDFVTLTNDKITKLTFTPYDVKATNFLIITAESLVEGSNNYAAYRSSAAGGGFKPLVANIKDIYNQFNYGEPSPVAIRKFVDYMLSDGNKEKYLLLIGKSITFNERMVRELPNEVPSVGLPASDVLLVEGLAGEMRDIPAIPVGRLAALLNQNVLDYLEKVKEYEQTGTGDVGWRKNVLHLNGGKTALEISQLKGLLADLEPVVTNGVLGGEVTPFVKQQGIAEVESVNITPEVNEGVGLITYFGHGSTTVTDLDMGYSTDAARGYNNNGKYPMMYFNGCGVGNIFTGFYNTNPSASDRYALSLDWILTPKKGAIAIIANSFESFVAPSEKYLSQLYQNMFSDPVTSSLSIGKIQSAVAKKILTEDPNIYNVANVHQSVLQGDPALKLVTVSRSDYAVNSDDGIFINSESASQTIESSGKLNINIVISNLGRFKKEEKVPVQVTLVYKDGNETSNEIISAIAYKDTVVLSVENKRILQRIEVSIDSAGTISELNKKNNIAELLVDWEVAKSQTKYPVGNNQDLIAPSLNVRFNGRNIENDEVIAPNPTVAITLEDDRFLDIDTSLVSVFIKPCGDENCDYKQLSYSSEGLTINSLTNRSIRINYAPKNWLSGIYEMLVIGKDQAGNSSVNPYTIRFSILENVDSTKVTIVTAPNPASTYVRFMTRVESIKSVQSIEYLIYDLSGRLIFNQKNNVALPSEINEFYWFPKSGSSGLFVYKVIINRNGLVEKQITGKLVIVN